MTNHIPKPTYNADPNTFGPAMEPVAVLTDKADDLIVSLVSCPDRCMLQVNGSLSGNRNERLFKGLLQQYQAQRVADPMMGSGMTRDVVEWLNHQRNGAISYWGGDLRTGFNLLRHDLPDKYDFLWVHPPYWNIIRYSDHPDDLSTYDDYGAFRIALKLCLCRCVDALVPGGRLAVLIGDVCRQGKYIPIMRDLLNMGPDIGRLRSIIIKPQNRCWSDVTPYSPATDVPIRHEYCLVFQKT